MYPNMSTHVSKNPKHPLSVHWVEYKSPGMNNKVSFVYKNGSSVKNYV